MREGCTPLSCCFAHPSRLSPCGDGMWEPTVFLQAKQRCIAGTQPGDGSTGCPNHAEGRDAALGHHHHAECPLLTKFNPILPLYASSCNLASPLIPLRHCATHSIPSSQHASAVRGVTSLSPSPWDTHARTTSTPASGLAGHRPPAQHSLPTTRAAQFPRNVDQCSLSMRQRPPNMSKHT